RTGLLILPTYEPARLAALAEMAEATGYDDFWLADERFFREAYASLTLCALRTRRMRLGPCVTDPYSRHPALTAMAIATLDEIAGGRAILALGAGVSGFRELGIDASRSAAAIREGVELIRRLLAGDTVTAKGRDVMRPSIVRSLSAQRPDFFTFATAGLTLPAALRDRVLALPYTHDPAPLRAVAPDVPDAFVDACTLTGPPDVIAPELIRLARSGIAQVMIYPLAVDGRIETTIQRFQTEVMPRVRAELRE